MFHAIKSKDVLVLLLFYCLYQIIWLLTLSVLYTGIHEKTDQIWHNVILALNPKTLILYSITLYPISLACLFVLITVTIYLKKHKPSFVGAFGVFILFMVLFNMVFLLIGNIFGSPLREMFNWISGSWNESIKTGLYGYVFGSIVFMLFYIPLMRSQNNYKLKLVSNGDKQVKKGPCASQ